MRPRTFLQSMFFFALITLKAHAQILGTAQPVDNSAYIPKVHPVFLGQTPQADEPATALTPTAKPILMNSCDLDTDPLAKIKTNLIPSIEALSKKAEDQVVKDSGAFIDVRVREPWAIERKEGQTQTSFPGNPNCGVAYPPAQKDDLELVVQNTYSSPTIAGQDRRRSYNDVPTSYRVCKVAEEGNRTVIYLKTNAYAKDCDVRSFNLYCDKKDGKPRTIADFNEGTNAGFLRMGYKLH